MCGIQQDKGWGHLTEMLAYLNLDRSLLLHRRIRTLSVQVKTQLNIAVRFPVSQLFMAEIIKFTKREM